MKNSDRISQLPANIQVLRYLGSPQRLAKSTSAIKQYVECPIDVLPDPYLELGTHPDLVGYLWRDTTKLVDVDCRWIVYGAPALICPISGVIFGFAEGTMTCALRLPLTEHAAALAAGFSKIVAYKAQPRLNIQETEIVASTIGPEWLFHFHVKDMGYWGSVAYNLARGGL